MKQLREAVPLAPVLEQIAASRLAYRAERIDRFGWAETISCPACGDTGTIPDALLTVCGCVAGDEVATRRRRQAAWEEAIPAAMRGWRLALAPDRAAGAEVRRWLANYPADRGEPSPNLILRGVAGAGKTGLAVAALADLCGRDIRIAFHVVADFLDTLRPGTPDAEQAAALRRAQSVAVLVLDDLGAERLTDFALERLYVVLNHRMNNGTPTIITTNLPHELLRQSAGERLARRITQDGRAWEVVVKRTNG